MPIITPKGISHKKTVPNFLLTFVRRRRMFFDFYSPGESFFGDFSPPPAKFFPTILRFQNVKKQGVTEGSWNELP